MGNFSSSDATTLEENEHENYIPRDQQDALWAADPPAAQRERQQERADDQHDLARGISIYSMPTPGCLSDI